MIKLRSETYREAWGENIKSMTILWHTAAIAFCNISPLSQSTDERVPCTTLHVIILYIYSIRLNGVAVYDHSRYELHA